jgi:hypothetical protein
MLAIGIVKAVRKCSLRLTSSLRRAHGLFEYGDYRSQYYVGIKLDAYSGYKNHIVLWKETMSRRKHDVEMYRDYLIRHIPDFDKKLLIRRISPIRESGYDFVMMAHTPFLPKEYYATLSTFSAILAAGRLIRASYTTSA